MLKPHAELIVYLFGQADHPLAQWCARRFATSPRFVEFIDAQRSKVRKKVRLAADHETQRDLLCELAVAYQLTNERSFAVSYEPLAAQGSSPDFGVQFKGHTQLYLEVTRARVARGGSQIGAEARLAALLCGKLRQLPAGAASLLVLVTDGFSLAGMDLDQALRLLRQRADAKDDAFFAFRGLEGVKAFQKQIALLSGVLLLSTSGAPLVVWQHRAARHQAPPEVFKLLNRWEIQQMELDTTAPPPAGKYIAQAEQAPGNWPGGTTRAIYAYPHEGTTGPANALLWVGTATIERAAPYTYFAGRKRVHVPVQGNGLKLHFQQPEETVAVVNRGQHTFAGDRPVTVELTDGQVLAFNLIVVNEAQAGAEVLELNEATTLPALAGDGHVVRVIYAVTGQLQVEHGAKQATILQPEDAYALESGQPLTIKPLETGVVVVVAALGLSIDT
jgi:environmental stress-induced protein Ves